MEIILLVFVWRIPGGDRLQNELSHELKYHIDLMDYSARSRDFLDLVQLKLQCCGAYSFVDYKNMQMPVPQSCSNDLTNNINYRVRTQICCHTIHFISSFMSCLLTRSSFSISSKTNCRVVARCSDVISKYEAEQWAALHCHYYYYNLYS